MNIYDCTHGPKWPRNRTRYLRLRKAFGIGWGERKKGLRSRCRSEGAEARMQRQGCRGRGAEAGVRMAGVRMAEISCPVHRPLRADGAGRAKNRGRWHRLGGNAGQRRRAAMSARVPAKGPLVPSLMLHMAAAKAPASSMEAPRLRL